LKFGLEEQRIEQKVLEIFVYYVLRSLVMPKLWIDKKTGLVKGEILPYVAGQRSPGRRLEISDDHWYQVDTITEDYILLENYMGRQVHLILNPKTMTVEKLLSDENIPFKFRDGTGSSPVSLALNRLFSYDFILDYIKLRFELVYVDAVERERTWH
jgi:hypothetical protein